jgi:hypothetical protein
VSTQNITARTTGFSACWLSPRADASYGSANSIKTVTAQNQVEIISPGDLRGSDEGLIFNGMYGF